jgi:hypothetical protein
MTLKSKNLVRFAALLLPIALVAGSGTVAANGGGFSRGWMTGGGSIFSLAYGGDPRITHGFELRCDLRRSNLQINDHAVGGWDFHLKDLTSAICMDDPAIEPNPPDASFDTFIGEGTGVCRNTGGQSVACVARWIFTDGGERGGCVRDTAVIEVVDANTNDTLIEVSDGYVDCGNHQAHSR